MENAKCLITDSSGIAIEFVLLFKKPVLYFEIMKKFIILNLMIIMI